MEPNQIKLSGKKNSFRPKKPDRTKFVRTPFHVDGETDARMTLMAKKCCMSKQELVRQMVKFCLDNEDKKGE